MLPWGGGSPHQSTYTTERQKCKNAFLKTDSLQDIIKSLIVMRKRKK